MPDSRRIVVGGGAELEVRTWGAAGTELPFVLLHGIASTSRAWDGVAPRLAAAGHPVYALDFRGHGRSSRPDDGYDSRTFAADVAAASAALGLERPILAGHSLGASVILELVARRPELPAAVALVEGGLAESDEPLDAFLARIALPPVAGMPAPAVEAYLRGSNPGWSDERIEAAMACFEIGEDGRIVDWWLGPNHYEALATSLWHERPADRWPSLRVPTLVVAADTGDAGWTAAKRAGAAAFAKVQPEARIVWLDGDHEIQAACPQPVAELLLQLASSLKA